MSEYSPLDRRPISSRDLPVFKGLASALVRLGVTANSISVAGAVAAIFSGAALAATPHLAGWDRLLWIAGAAFAQLRLVANLLDGMVAIESKTASPVGELYNEVPDRVSDTAILIGLGLAAGGHVLLGLAAALAAMFTAYVRTTAKAAGSAMDFCGPMAKQHRMFVVTLTCLYLAAAPRAWRPVCPPHPTLGIPAAALALITLGSIVTALRRLARAGTALRKKQ